MRQRQGRRRREEDKDEEEKEEEERRRRKWSEKNGLEEGREVKGSEEERLGMSKRQLESGTEPI